MKNVEKYKKYFTKEYMMGPNALRLLSEIAARGRSLGLFCWGKDFRENLLAFSLLQYRDNCDIINI